ncbi:nucleoside deaminase [Sinorhizobium terangae]|uniref:Nucleoside deaminase n=1 Tax=Sinorhizobium terangae TaxID=110322 RepID=A0A6N7LNI1_SINTE|nr:nucleoside deaminase [Sinorhizobium terangae]MBB4183688.1 tRNA(Arg) A34 adenosine deaminase TadA [Sinorhizobium terangae]MQX18820.1 nucleoside deaminase [Sinorhizobium terangae]WFU47836.1 nucleoside deaminase [Sinorhizobium terangae]
MDEEQRFLREAVSLARSNMENGGRPFGAVVVKDSVVIATGVNEMARTGDPTSHAELNALRAAAKALQSLRLEGCTVYASGQPCPMCLAAMRMAGINEISYAHSNTQAEPYGLSTSAIYAELAKPVTEQAMRFRHVPLEVQDAVPLYAEWQKRQQTS